MASTTNGSATLLPNTHAGKQVRNRLSEDRTLQALDHLLARIDTLDTAVENLSSIMQQAPGLVAIAGDTFDDVCQEADAKGINIDERLRNALDIAEKLTAPAMVEKLDAMLKLTDQLPGFVAMKVDSLDEMYADADAKGISVDERLGVALQMAEKLTAPAMVEKLDMMLQMSDQLPGLVAIATDSFDEYMSDSVDSGFDPKALAETVRAANHALTCAKAEPPTKVGGIFGMLRVMKDPDRQRGIGFLMNFLKHFGKNI